MIQLPTHAKVVIIGGGVVGCSVAYHLTKFGWTDVVLLERKQLTSGTTWHAAGLIGQLRATSNMTKLAKYSAELYEGLEAETGLATGYRRTGSVSLALSQDRMIEYKRQASMAKTFDLQVDVLTPAQCKTLHPLAGLDDVVGGLHIPRDGQADPSNIAHALAKGARTRGARIFERIRVTDIKVEHGRAVSVVTDHGAIAVDYVVNCAGMWARDVGLMAGVNVPLQACEHFYVLTEPVEGIPRGLPTLRVPDECTYYKEDAGKLMAGFFEPVAKPWAVSGIPEDFEFDTLPDDWDHLMPQLELAMARVPTLAEKGIHTFFNGPESFTPDDRYLLGEAPNVERYFVAAGFNSVGIQSAGGAGKALAEWMIGGSAPYDLGDVDIRRMLPYQGNKSYLVTRATESLGLLYADHYPYRQFATARNIRHSPIHECLAAAGACFAEAGGWERPGWYLPDARKDDREAKEYRYSWGRQNWFPYSAEEHRAVRNTVGLFDMSPFAKFRVEGRDAEAVLQRICAANVAVEPGRIVYSQWLNTRGGIEADVTITRLSETEFLVVTSAAQAVRDFAWLKRNIPADAHCIATDVTAGEGCLAIMGPNARALLAPLTSADLSNEAFPFGTAKTIELGMGHVRAHRVTYVGELGWELYVASDQARHIFDVVTARGADHGLRFCGIHAMDSCRIEKAYRHFGHDISDEDHVLEAGLGFAVKVDKPTGRFGDFIGRAAVIAKRQAGLRKRLVQFKLEYPEPLLFHGEPIWRDGRVVGYLTSGNYGHHLGAAIGLGYVPCDPQETPADIVSSRYDIECACERIRATASLRPLYDPQSERVRL